MVDTEEECFPCEKRERTEGKVGGGIPEANEEIPVPVFRTATNFNAPRSLRDGFVLEVVVVDGAPPDLTAYWTKVGCVGPVGGAPLA